MNTSAKVGLAVVGLLTVGTLGAVAVTQGKPPVVTKQYSISFSSSVNTVEVGKSVSFSVFIEQTNPTSQPLANIPVTVKDVKGNVLSAGTTDSSGKLNFTHTFETAGTYMFSAVGESTLFSSNGSTGIITSGSITITVTTAPIVTDYVLMLSATNTSINTGGTVTFTAKAVETAPTAGPVPNTVITIIESGTGSEGTAITDRSGVASITVKFPDSGTYSVYAQFTSSSGKVIKSEQTITITVHQAVTHAVYEVTLTPSTTEVIRGGTVQFKVTVFETSPVSSGITGANVTIYAENGSTQSGKTTSGEFNTSMAFPIAGTVGVYATASSSLFGTLKSATVNITVIPPNVTSPRLTSPPHLVL